MDSDHKLTLRNYEDKHYVSTTSLAKACNWSNDTLTQKVYQYNNYTAKHVKRIETRHDADGEWVGYKEATKLLEYHTDGFNSMGTSLHALLQKMRRYNPSKEGRKRKLTQTNKIVVAAEQKWRCGKCNELLSESF